VLPDTSWLLLIWTGLAATIFASVLVAPLAAKNARGAIPYMRPASLGDSLLLAVLGVLVYPAIYGLILDALHTASILAGAVLGLVHALVLVLYTRINRRAQSF
jgi:hypothetical protein